MLKRGDDFILWSHFTRVPYLYETNELRCTKLITDDRLRLNSYAKMRVICAAQTLSQSVSNVMLARGEEMKGSAWIAALFNKWFDCMNTILRPTPSTNLLPYYSEDDARLN